MIPRTLRPWTPCRTSNSTRLATLSSSTRPFRSNGVTVIGITPAKGGVMGRSSGTILRSDAARAPPGRSRRARGEGDDATAAPRGRVDGAGSRTPRDPRRGGRTVPGPVGLALEPRRLVDRGDPAPPDPGRDRHREAHLEASQGDAERGR